MRARSRDPAPLARPWCSAAFRSWLSLADPGTATLAGDQVLVAPEDTLENQVLTLYFRLSRVDRQRLGVAQQAVLRDLREPERERLRVFPSSTTPGWWKTRLVLAREFLRGDASLAVQLSARRCATRTSATPTTTTNEYFDRRDLTGTLHVSGQASACDHDRRRLHGVLHRRLPGPGNRGLGRLVPGAASASSPGCATTPWT